jgi:hypothetical protein
MDQDLWRTCPQCGEKDRTSFNTCKFCGTKYSAQIAAAGTKTENIGIMAVVIIIAAILISCTLVMNGKPRHSASASNSKYVANKPRLIELYTNWSGCEQGHARCIAYNNIVGQCASIYAGKVDFQMLNMDNEHDREIGYKLANGGLMLALPTIYLFNSNGDQIAQFNDNLTFAELDKYLRDPGLYK